MRGSSTGSHRSSRSTPRDRRIATCWSLRCAQDNARLHLRYHLPPKALHDLVTLRKWWNEAHLLQAVAFELPELLHQLRRLADDAEVPDDLRREEACLLGLERHVVAR